MGLFDRHLLGSILVVAASGLLVALILGRRTSWSMRRILWSAASPIPILTTLLAAAVFVDAITASREECGVDACGMAMLGSYVLLFLAGFAFILSAIAARVGYWLSKR